MPTLSAADRPSLAAWRARAAAGAAEALAELRGPQDWHRTRRILPDFPAAAGNPMRRGRERFQYFHPHHFTESNRTLRERAATLRDVLRIAATETEPSIGRWAAVRLQAMIVQRQARAREFMRSLSRWTLAGCIRVLPHFPGLAARRFLLHEVREVLPPAMRVIIRRVIAPGAPHAALSAAPCV